MRWDPPTIVRPGPDGRYDPLSKSDFPVFVLHVDLNSGFEITPNYHEYFELSWMHTGSGTYAIAGQEVRVVEGDVILIRDKVFHAVRVDSPAGLKVVGLHFQPALVCTPSGGRYGVEFLRPFLDHSIDAHAVISGRSGAAADIISHMARISRELSRRGPHFELGALAGLYALLATVAKHYDKVVPDPSGYNRLRSRMERLKPAVGYLESHFHERVAMTTLATLANMSRSHFFECFRSVTGHTVTQYCNRLRVDRAKQLLMDGDMAVAEVGYEVGFESHSHFDRVFRGLSGCSPTRFRKSGRPAVQ